MKRRNFLKTIGVIGGATLLLFGNKEGKSELICDHNDNRDAKWFNQQLNDHLLRELPKRDNRIRVNNPRYNHKSFIEYYNSHENILSNNYVKSDQILPRQFKTNLVGEIYNDELLSIIEECIYKEYMEHLTSDNTVFIYRFELTPLCFSDKFGQYREILAIDFII